MRLLERIDVVAAHTKQLHFLFSFLRQIWRSMAYLASWFIPSVLNLKHMYNKLC